MARVTQTKSDKYPPQIILLIKECAWKPKYEELDKVYQLMESVFRTAPTHNLPDLLDSFTLYRICTLPLWDKRCNEFFETWLLTIHSQRILIDQAIEIGPAQEIKWIQLNCLIYAVDIATEFSTPRDNRRIRLTWIRAILNRMREPLIDTFGKPTFADNVKAFGKFLFPVITPLLQEIPPSLDEDLMLLIMKNLGKMLPINVIVESVKILMEFGVLSDSEEGDPEQNTEEIMMEFGVLSDSAEGDQERNTKGILMAFGVQSDSSIGDPEQNTERIPMEFGVQSDSAEGDPVKNTNVITCVEEEPSKTSKRDLVGILSVLAICVWYFLKILLEVAVEFFKFLAYLMYLGLRYMFDRNVQTREGECSLLHERAAWDRPSQESTVKHGDQFREKKCARIRRIVKNDRNNPNAPKVRHGIQSKV